MRINVIIMGFKKSPPIHYLMKRSIIIAAQQNAGKYAKNEAVTISHANHLLSVHSGSVKDNDGKNASGSTG